MRHSGLIRILAAAAVLVFPATASADKTPPRASIAAKATLSSPTEIILEVRLKCEEGQAWGLIFDVLQETWGVAVASGQCTGDNQYAAVPVYNERGWDVGDAQAYLGVWTSTGSVQEARLVRIEL